MTAVTVRELADRVLEARRSAWAKADPQVAVVATGQLNPEDREVVRRIVAGAGYEGQQLDDMVRQVSALVVNQIEALADHMPADGGD